MARRTGRDTIAILGSLMALTCSSTEGSVEGGGAGAMATGPEALPLEATFCRFPEIAGANIGNWFDPTTPLRLFLVLAECVDPTSISVTDAVLDGHPLPIADQFMCYCSSETQAACSEMGDVHCTTPGSIHYVVFDHLVDVSTWDAAGHSGSFSASVQLDGEVAEVQIAITDRHAEQTCSRDQADCWEVECIPLCGECGGDGCGGTCGSCPSGESCQNGTCVGESTPCPAGCSSPVNADVCCAPPFCSGNCIGSPCCD